MARLLFSAPKRSTQSHPSILVSRSNYGPMVDIFRDFLDSSHCTSLEMAWHPAVAEGEKRLIGSEPPSAVAVSEPMHTVTNPNC